ncbi:Pimeloyl-ACP methyl ester carboxylesterase [Tenacibaculum sp. MAR_2009_124]|uniref:alpha/beta hydrolase n=1 Tax=Tenacibaculum sp. MAR_2009_124 TaxID=1250059 RepID=UPI00089BF649|nr:alpha/beta hydrolase [Tenacibaculum sp. MAR_2009_124]SEB35069.1 Pimeloyl-ACP methyl ester carboxylesterase [Tenacibaculum sp. MAR_2009_124]
MTKIPIYFVPGLAANTKIFEHISLPEEHFELIFLDWILPANANEPIQDYAQRMCKKIQHENPILVGVSFGGIMVQEMSKHISFNKVIIISSIKNNQELPNRLKLAQITKAYKLFPSKIISNIEKYEQYFFSDYLKKRAELYKIYLSVRDKTYLQWAIFNVLHWAQSETLPYITHIHGDNDEIFPLKNIKGAQIIEQGTHIMILNKAKTISKILETECFLLN